MFSWIFAENKTPPTASLPAAAEDWFSDGIVPADWTFARSAAALSRGTNGRWSSYAANVIRPYHHPVSLARLGFMLETQARTQLIHRSRSTAGVVGVVANNATITTDAAVQTPFGVGGTKIVPTTTVAQHGYNLSFNSVQAAAVGDNTTVAFQVYLKPTGAFYTRGEYFLLNRAGVYSGVAFTLEGSGSVTTTGSVTAAITPDTDGFYLLTMVMQYGAGTTNPTCNLLLLPASGARSHAGDGTSGFWMAYFGAEVGTEPTSPILSDGTVTVTRPAETFTSATNWMQGGAKTFGIQYTPLSVGSSQTILFGTASDLLEIRNSGSTVTYNASFGGTSSAAITGTAPAPGIERTVLVVAGSDEFRLVQNGTILGTDTTGPVPLDIPVLRIGSAFGGFDGGALLLKRLKYWNLALSATDAQAYAADLSKVGQISVKPVLDIQPTRTVQPSETSITLIVTLAGEASGPIVHWTTVDGTAQNGVDYVGNRGILGFSPGVNSGEIVIDLATRSTTEDRTFTVELSGPIGATLGISRCTVTLQRVVQQGPAAATQTIFGATPSANFTLTRGSTANARNASGIWTSVAANTQRHHYVATGVSGLLIEPAAAEQRLYDSVNPSFTATESTITTDTTTQTPTGVRSIRWRKNTTAAEHRIGTTLTTANCDMPTGEFTLSLMLKPVGSLQYWRLRVKGIDNVWREVRYDLSGAGTIAAADSGTINYVEADPFFSGWYRISMDRSQAATAGVSAEFDLTPVDSFGNVSTAGDTSQGVDICHVQLEVGAGVSSPIIVQGASAKTTRAADVLKATGTWFNQQSYTLGMRLIRLRNEPVTQTLWQARDTANTTTNDLQALQVESGSYVLRTRTGGVTRTVITGGTSTVGSLSTVLMVVDSASRIALFDNGVKRGEGATVTAPVALSVLRIGSTEPNGVNPGSILIQAVYLWTSALADADAVLFSGNLAYSPPPGPAVLPVLSIPAAMSVREGNTLSVPVTKAGAGACSVTFRTKAGTATLTTDYVGVLQTVSFNSNDTTLMVDIVTVSDAVADANENFQIILETPTGATLGNAVCVATITELPRITMPATFSVNEGSAANITLSKVGTGACSVVVQTGQVTATVGVDYTGVGPLTISFTADQTSAVVSVPTSTDAAAESTETFNLNMTGAVGCTIGTPQCVVSIIDASSEPEPPSGIFAAPRGFATDKQFGIARTGGDYYRVTTTDDTGTGSLRAGLALSNRVIIFEVGGVIVWRTDLRPTGSFLTIAGETAPSPGITIQGIQSNGGGLLRWQSAVQQIHWSHIAFERCYADPTGSPLNTNSDSWTVEPTAGGFIDDIWIDHCSFFWSNDENVQIYHQPNTSDTTTGVRRMSFTNSMICEPFRAPEALIDPATGRAYLGHYENGATERGHNYNFLIGPKTRPIDIQYCMFSEAAMRNPFIDKSAQVVMANNLSINCSLSATIEMNAASATDPYRPHLITCVGYLKISGPNATTDSGVFRFHLYPTTLPAGSKYYLHDLYGMKGGRAADITPTQTVVWAGNNQSSLLVAKTAAKPIDIPGGSTAMSANDIYERAKANVGPRPKENNGNRMNPPVARAIQKLRNKAGAWVNHERVDGGGLGKTTFARTTRLLNGSTSFPDGTAIPAPPAYSNAAQVKAWLKLFRDRLQYD